VNNRVISGGYRRADWVAEAGRLIADATANISK